MASIIRVKRSTGTAAPSTLNFGELGLTVGVGTHGNKGGRLFAGDNGSNPQEVGGRYFTDLLSIAPGLVAGQVNPTTAANGFVPIVDQSGRVDHWNVDNLRLDGNTLSSTDANGDILLDEEEAKIFEEHEKEEGALAKMKVRLGIFSSLLQGKLPGMAASRRREAWEQHS